MKKTIFALTAVFSALTAFISTQAQANQEGFYVGGFGGANWLQTNRKHHHGDGEFHHKFRTGYVAGGSVGYKWCQGYRLEGEIAYRRNQLKKSEITGFDESARGHFQSISYMANALYDMELGGWNCCAIDVVPYVGVGIGYSTQKLKLDHHSFSFEGKNKKNGFAWQLIAGLGYEISCNTDLALEYRFHVGHAKHLYNHALDLAVRYHF